MPALLSSKATLEHMALILQKERAATLAETAIAVSAQRKATSRT